jgi:hypothetical protein
LEVVFILLEFSSPSRRIFVGSHSLPPLWSPDRSFSYERSFGPQSHPAWANFGPSAISCRKPLQPSIEINDCPGVSATQNRRQTVAPSKCSLFGSPSPRFSRASGGRDGTTSPWPVLSPMTERSEDVDSWLWPSPVLSSFPFLSALGSHT